VTSSPLLPVQHIPYIPRPGTWTGRWVPTCAPMRPDEWPDANCPAGGHTTGAHTSSERPLGFASSKEYGRSEAIGPFDRSPDPRCVLGPTAYQADSTEEGPRWLMYGPLCSTGLYSRAGTRGGKLLLDSWGKSIGPGRVGQAGGLGTTAPCE